MIASFSPSQRFCAEADAWPHTTIVGLRGTTATADSSFATVALGIALAMVTPVVAWAAGLLDLILR